LYRDLRTKLPNGRFEGTSPQRADTMRAIKGRNNRTTERRLRLALVRAGIKGWTVCPARTQGNPDFWFPERRLAVFVDGCFWHGCPVCCGRSPKSHTEYWTAKIERNRAKDRATTQKLESAGVRVLRVWEHELKQDIAGCVTAVHANLMT
jgi:DNA mismatch endonuclease Vsr